MSIQICDFFFLSGSLVARTHTFLMWRSGVSGVRTPTPAYIMHLSLPTELSSPNQICDFF